METKKDLKDFKKQLNYIIKEIEINSDEKLKKIYTNNLLIGSFLVDKKDKFINHYTRNEAEIILNKLHQNKDIKKALKKALKVECGNYLKKFKINL